MKYGSAVVVLLAIGACSTIREEMPTTPTQTSANPVIPSAPVVVVPVPVPVPVPTAGPGPAPGTPAPTTPAPNTPNNPRPNPTPAPSGGHDDFSNLPVTQVSAGVHSYLRNGRLVPTGGTEFKVGD